MQDKALQAKRKHHYVWANYLKRWSTNNRDIFYTTTTGKIAHDSILGGCPKMVDTSRLSKADKFYSQHLVMILAVWAVFFLYCHVHFPMSKFWTD